MAKRTHPVSPPAALAVQTLGLQIATGRRARQWKAEDLAQRVGINVRTLRKVEQGFPTVAIGIVMELATLVGVPIFGVAPDELSDVRLRAADGLALLPARIYEPRTGVDDDF